MRGLPRWNFDTFYHAAESFRGQGAVILSPAEHDVEQGLDPDDYPDLPEWFSLEDCMRWDLQQVCAADGIILLPGWQKSEGALREKQVAEWAGREILEAVSTFDGSWSATPLPADYALNVYEESLPHSWAPKLTLKGEIRVTDPVSGASKGSKLARFDLVPEDVMVELAEHYGKGCEKYDARNWEGGYAYGLSYAAARRHMAAFWAGEDTDEETGSSHLIAAAWHLIALRWFQKHNKGTDDRSAP
jgi:hypothetical protein